MTKARDLGNFINAGGTIPGTITADGLSLGDNEKAIFGAGSDLEIFHSGTTSYIRDVGDGDLQIVATDDVYIRGYATNNYMARFNENSYVQLYYNNALKFSTTSTGVDVTGSIAVTGTVDGRDVAADGTKLDGIEANADVTDTVNVTAAGALMDSELTNITAVKALDQGVATTDNPTFAAVKEGYSALSGTTPTIDAASSGGFALTTSGNTTFTFAAVTSGRSVGFVLKLTAGGTHTITWPASVDWAAATAPDAPASGETNMLVFTTFDGGTTWYGFQAGAALA